MKPKRIAVVTNRFYPQIGGVEINIRFKVRELSKHCQVDVLTPVRDRDSRREQLPEMTVYRDEIFGPVLSVMRVDTYAEATELIRTNPWGNGTAIFTRDGGAARSFQEDADAGMVGINVPIPVPVGQHSFGGWKDSAFGDTTVYGPEGFHFYTRPKVITARWPDPATSAVDLGFPTNT